MPTRPRLENLSGVLRVYKRLKTVPERVERSQLAMARDILRLSGKYVPVEHGDLKDTGRVEANGESGKLMEHEVIYGGVSMTGRDVFYAVVVHERTDLNHEPPTCAKFLLRAFYETYVRGKETVRDSFHAAIILS